MEPLEIEKRIIKEELQQGDTLLLRITLEYPHIKSPKNEATEKINQYYRDMVDKLVDYGRDTLIPMVKEEYSYAQLGGMPFRSGELYLTYQIAYQKDCILSLFFDQYEFLGGAHGSTERFSQTWNVETGEMLELKSCFASPKYYKEDTIEMIRMQVKKEMDQGEKKYYRECYIDIEHTFKDSNFYLTDKGVIVYFQQYEIGPYASGIPEFLLPYSDEIKMIECKEKNIK